MKSSDMAEKCSKMWADVATNITMCLRNNTITKNISIPKCLYDYITYACVFSFRLQLQRFISDR